VNRETEKEKTRLDLCLAISDLELLARRGQALFWTVPSTMKCRVRDQ